MTQASVEPESVPVGGLRVGAARKVWNSTIAGQALVLRVALTGTCTALS